MTSNKTARLLKQASYASVAVAFVLIIVKTLTVLMTDSVGVFASLLDSSMDAITSIINLFAVRYALKPADDEHRFGYGKAEDLAGLAQAAFIAGTAVFLLINATERLLHPSEIQHAEIAIAVMVFSVLLTLPLVMFQRYVVRQTKSNAIAGDSLHYEGDILMNAAIIAGLVFALYGFGWVDAALGLLIGLYILVSAIRLGLRSANMLMDVDMGEDVRQRICEIVDQHPEVKGLHELRTRQSGHLAFIQMHIELDGSLSLLDAHLLTEEIEEKVKAQVPNAEVFIHQDPISVVTQSPKFTR